MAKFIYVPNTVRNTDDAFLANPNVGWKEFTSRYKNEGLSDVGTDDELFIVGHGSLAGTSLNTLDAKALLEALKADKLDQGHVDFHLFSCYSGVKMPGASQCFAEAFAVEIRDYYKKARVTGYLGAVRFDRNPDQEVVSKDTTFSNLVKSQKEIEPAGLNEVSFSVKINRYSRHNSVVPNQAESHIATVSRTIRTEASPFGEASIKSTKVLVW